MKLNMAVLIAVFLMVCDSGKGLSGRCEMSDPESVIEIINPRGGETFTYGQQVKIQWRADASFIANALVQVSVDSGVPKNILDSGIPIVSESGVVCMEYIWTIGGESDSINYLDGSKARIKISEYTSSFLFDISDQFIINMP